MAASSNCFPIGRMRRFPSMPIIHRGITLPQRSEHLSILFLMLCTDRRPNAVNMWSARPEVERISIHECGTVIERVCLVAISNQRLQVRYLDRLGARPGVARAAMLGPWVAGQGIAQILAFGTEDRRIF